MTGPAARRWESQLQAWALPQSLLDAVGDSPYSWPVEMWKRRALAADQSGDISPTTERVQSLATPSGSVLDVGAGTGRASLPLARRGHSVTAVEPTRSMLEGLRQLGAGLPITIVEGRWPDVAGLVAAHQVALSSHVVYDVGSIGPFLQSLNARALGGVVINLTPVHPWAHLTPYYLALQGLDRPDGPRVDDLIAVIEEVLGVHPHLDLWSRPTDLWFESKDEILEFYGRRLVLPRARWPDLAALLEADIVGEASHLQIRPVERDLCTLWWGQ